MGHLRNACVCGSHASAAGGGSRDSMGGMAEPGMLPSARSRSRCMVWKLISQLISLMVAMQRSKLQFICVYHVWVRMIPDQIKHHCHDITRVFTGSGHKNQRLLSKSKGQILGLAPFEQKRQAGRKPQSVEVDGPVW